MEQRVIKFKVWDNVKKRFYHPCDNRYDTAITFSGDKWDCFSHFRGTIDELVNSSDNSVLLQFAGLHDKNGKEIYEGCIISNVDNKSYKFGSIGVVRYESDYGGFIVEGKYSINQHHSNLDCDLAYECAVIGNIFEHPHLLNT